MYYFDPSDQARFGINEPGDENDCKSFESKCLPF